MYYYFVKCTFLVVKLIVIISNFPSQGYAIDESNKTVVFA